jgi:hypothetical protein
MLETISIILQMHARLPNLIVGANRSKAMAYWKINCMEDKYPGLWQTWFTEQIVAVGWPPLTWKLHGKNPSPDWRRARRHLMAVAVGDKVIVQLKNWRVGRVGTVLEKRIEDSEWKPSVPAQSGDNGEMGRRISVRWDLTSGRLTPDYVVELPEDARPNPGIWRPTLSPIPRPMFAKIERAIREQDHWARLIPGFASERALSDYIAARPH